MNEAQETYLNVGRTIAEAIESQMFGKPCFKINSKAFIAFFNDNLVCKLSGDAHREALSLDGSKLFDPSGKGRAMKEWVEIDFSHKNEWQKFAEKAAEFVKNINK